MLEIIWSMGLRKKLLRSIIQAQSHEFIFNYLLKVLQFFNYLWIHQVPSFPYESAFPAEMISIHHSLYPGVQLLWCSEKNYKQTEEKKGMRQS
jgi:hypothetical protein